MFFSIFILGFKLGAACFLRTSGLASEGGGVTALVIG